MDDLIKSVCLKVEQLVNLRIKVGPLTPQLAFQEYSPGFQLIRQRSNSGRLYLVVPVPSHFHAPTEHEEPIYLNIDLLSCIPGQWPAQGYNIHSELEDVGGIPTRLLQLAGEADYTTWSRLGEGILTGVSAWLDNEIENLQSNYGVTAGVPEVSPRLRRLKELGALIQKLEESRPELGTKEATLLSIFDSTIEMLLGRSKRL